VPSKRRNRCQSVQAARSARRTLTFASDWLIFGLSIPSKESRILCIWRPEVQFDRAKAHCAVFVGQGVQPLFLFDIYLDGRGRWAASGAGARRAEPRFCRRKGLPPTGALTANGIRRGGAIPCLPPSPPGAEPAGMIAREVESMKRVYECDICKRARLEVRRSRISGELICKPCYLKAHHENLPSHEKCTGCGKMKWVAARRSGEPVCADCCLRLWPRDPSRYKKCRACGMMGPVTSYNKVGEPICRKCYLIARRLDPSLRRRCSQCGKLKEVRGRTKTGEAICAVCYQHSKTGTCVACGIRGVIQALGRCYRCYQRHRRARIRSFEA
jgi:hypothetical protein